MIFLYVPLELKYCHVIEGRLTLSFMEYGREVHIRESFPGVEALYEKIIQYPIDFMDAYNKYRELAGLRLYDRLQFFSFLDADLQEVNIVCRESILPARLLDWKRHNPEDIRKELAHDRLTKEKIWLDGS